MKTGKQPRAAPPSQPSPCWNVFSLFAPFAGLLGGVAVVLGSGNFSLAFSLLSGSCVFGLLAAVIAMARAERGGFITGFAMLLNGFAIFCWLFS